MQLTYYCNLKGNKEKLEFLEKQHHYVQVISRYYLMWIRKNKDYRITEIHKSTYHKIRAKYPFLYSKLIQHTRDKVLSSVKAKKLFKVRNFRIPLIFDYQNFGIEFKDGYYNAWIRFCKHNFPIEGLRTIEKIRGKKIKEIQIKKMKTGWRIYFVCEVPVKNNVTGNEKFGLDVNLKNVTLSSGVRYNLKRFVHKKVEYRKKKQREEISRFSRSFFHDLTSRMVKELVEMGGSQIILENLTNIRKSSSRKEGTSKGKHLNYLLNNVFPYRMFQSFLDYKCRLNGLEVQYINPKNTSKTCGFCGSLNTERPEQSLLICKDCGRKQNADFNGAKNIGQFSLAHGLLSHSNQSKLLKQIDKPIGFSHR